MDLYIITTQPVLNKLDPDHADYDTVTASAVNGLFAPEEVSRRSVDGQKGLIVLNYDNQVTRDHNGDIVEGDPESMLIRPVFDRLSTAFNLALANSLVDQELITAVEDLLNMTVVNALISSGNIASVEEAFNRGKLLSIIYASPLGSIEEVLDGAVVAPLLESGTLAKVENCFLANTRNSLINNGFIIDHSDLFNNNVVNALIASGHITVYEDVFSKATVQAIVDLRPLQMPEDVLNKSVVESLTTGTIESYTIETDYTPLDDLVTGGVIEGYYTYEEILIELEGADWTPDITPPAAPETVSDPHRYYLVVPQSTFAVIDPDSENFNSAIAENLQRFQHIEGVKFGEIVRRIETKAIVEVAYDGGQYLDAWLAEDPQRSAADYDIRQIEFARLQPYLQSGLIEEVLAYPDATVDRQGNPLFESIENYLAENEEWSPEEQVAE